MLRLGTSLVSICFYLAVYITMKPIPICRDQYACSGRLGAETRLTNLMCIEPKSIKDP